MHMLMCSCAIICQKNGENCNSILFGQRSCFTMIRLSLILKKIQNHRQKGQKQILESEQLGTRQRTCLWARKSEALFSDISFFLSLSNEKISLGKRQKTKTYLCIREKNPFKKLKKNLPTKLKPFKIKSVTKHA